MVPGTDHISDREANNFCEEFKLLGKAPDKKINPKSVENRLFGEKTPENKADDDSKQKFNRLFE